MPRTQFTGSKGMRFADLFAGIGGFHYALEQIMRAKPYPVMVAEIDQWAKETYVENFNYSLDKIQNIKFFSENPNELQKIGEFDLLMGGFPCQSFSNAGKKEGFLDVVRGTLFFDIAKIIDKTRPKYILLENVKHITKHDNGHTWKKIIKTLREMNYIVSDEPIILSPHMFGIKQIRERVFIPGVNKDKANLTEINCFKKSENFLPTIKNPSSLNDIKFDNSPDPLLFIVDTKVLQAIKAWSEFIKNVKRPSGRTLPPIWIDYLNDEIVDTQNMANWRKKYIEDMKLIYSTNKQWIDKWKNKFKTNTWSKREKKLEWQAGRSNYDAKNSFLQLRQSGYRFKEKTIFPTLVAIVQTPIIFDNKSNKWRKLSLNEVRQLQCFPSEFRFCKNEHQAYKQFGNAINVEVVKFILNKMLKNCPKWSLNTLSKID